MRAARRARRWGQAREAVARQGSGMTPWTTAGGAWSRPSPRGLAAVERSVDLRRSGATLQAIAQALNAEGLPTKRGAVWRAGTVRAVLMRAG
jgi:hypothetical protein